MPDDPEATLSMDYLLSLGFGVVCVTRDGVPVFEDDGGPPGATDWDDFATVADAEREAAKEPDHDWRIHYFNWGAETHYRRTGPGRWTLYKRGKGFA